MSDVMKPTEAFDPLYGGGGILRAYRQEPAEKLPALLAEHSRLYGGKTLSGVVYSGPSFEASLQAILEEAKALLEQVSSMLPPSSVTCWHTGIAPSLIITTKWLPSTATKPFRMQVLSKWGNKIFRSVPAFDNNMESHEWAAREWMKGSFPQATAQELTPHAFGGASHTGEGYVFAFKQPRTLAGKSLGEAIMGGK